MDERVFDYQYMTEPFCAKGQAVVTADTLNVRAGYSTQYEIVGKLARATIVTVWAVGQDWFLVQDANGLTGWCSSAYLRVIDQLIA